MLGERAICNDDEPHPSAQNALEWGTLEEVGKNYITMVKPLRVVMWLAVALAGTLALSTIALHRGEQINAMWLVVAAFCSYALGYRFYSKFIAAKWCPKTTHLLVGTKSRPSSRRSAGVAR